jgi:LL-diaminopimelate aminotransferase
MKVSQRLNGIGEYYFSQKLKEINELNRSGDAIINLGIGSPDLPPHPEVVRVLQEQAALQNVHGYQSYKGADALRNAFADWYKQWYHVTLNPATEVLPLIGSKEGIMHICMTYLDAGDEVLIPNPGYPTYRSAVQLAGGKCVEYELKEADNWLINFSELEQRDLSKVKMMWVNYPQMPTGQLPTKGLFKELIAFGKKHNILICHDNPYSFILNEKPMSLLATEGAKDVAIELNSLSKSHNMAGWRVGVICGSQERIDEILRFKSNMDSGMFLPAQMAAAKALTLGVEWFEEVNSVYEKRKQRAYALLDLLDCTYSKQQAGLFVWASIPSQYEDGYALSDEILYKARVFITPGGIFGSAGSKYVRVSLCSTEEKFQTSIDRIKSIVKK